MPMDPRMLAAVMQRMQPQGGMPPGTNTPVPPSAPPPNAMQAGMPVQMQGTMMMKPAQPPGAPSAPPGQMAPGAGAAPGMPPRNF